MAHRFQELETDGKAVVAQALAISDAGLGAKIARKRFEMKDGRCGSSGGRKGHGRRER